MSGTELLRLRFAAEARNLKQVRENLARALAHGGCAEDCADDIRIAVDEACQNIIRHAYAGRGGDILLEVSRQQDEIVIRLSDYAPPVDPTAIRPRSLEDIRPGGLGTHFIREVMDEVRFLPAPPGVGNLLQMIKRIDAIEH